jgi:hypothetical protein
VHRCDCEGRPAGVLFLNLHQAFHENCIQRYFRYLDTKNHPFPGQRPQLKSIVCFPFPFPFGSGFLRSHIIK